MGVPMYSDFAKREKTPQEILLEEALKDAQAASAYGLVGA